MITFSNSVVEPWMPRAFFKKRHRIEHRRATGQSIGGRPKTNKAKEGLVLRLREEGCSYRSIREQTGLALSTIRRIIAEQEVVGC